jgi:hypothetical protein
MQINGEFCENYLLTGNHEDSKHQIWCLCPPWRELFGSYCLPASLLMLNNKQKAYVKTVWARDLELILL